MKKKEQELHDFHFMLDKRMVNDLKNLNMYKFTQNLSGVIVKILSIIAPGLEKEHFIGKQRWSKYKYVNDDLTIKRKNTHVYLPFFLYKRLKLIHQDLNFYSIAQLLRFFLGLFLDLAKKYGENIELIQNFFVKKCEKKTEKMKFSNKLIKQLSQLLKQKTKKISLINIYNAQFIPIHIYRL